MTPDQHTIREALREALRDLAVIRVDTPQAELLIRAREHVAAALDLIDPEAAWPDFVDGDMPR